MSAIEAEKLNLLDLDRERLVEFFAQLGEKPFRARQVLQWVHQRGVTDFAQMTDLSRNLRELLTERAEVRAPRLIREQLSKDGTVKWLLSEAGGSAVETVFIPEADRGTLCIS